MARPYVRKVMLFLKFFSPNLDYGVPARSRAGACTPPVPVPGHAQSLIKKPRKFFRPFKNKGAGARVLRSTAAVSDECFSSFASFGCKTWCDPTTRPPASLGVQGSSEGFPRGPKSLQKHYNDHQGYSKHK